MSKVHAGFGRWCLFLCLPPVAPMILLGYLDANGVLRIDLPDEGTFSTQFFWWPHQSLLGRRMFPLGWHGQCLIPCCSQAPCKGAPDIPGPLLQGKGACSGCWTILLLECLVGSHALPPSHLSLAPSPRCDSLPLFFCKCSSGIARTNGLACV